MVRYNMNTARKEFTDLVNRAAYGGERIVIGRRNKDLAVLVPMADAELLERLEDRMDLREAEEALQDPRLRIPWKKAKKMLDKKSKKR
jgi:prevent-host-death family protein